MMELAPCRKCGGDAQMRGSRDGDVDWYQCRKCGYESPPRYSAAEAVAAWNAPEPITAPANAASREARAQSKPFAVDAKVEYPAFTSWWKRTIPRADVPSSASHHFGAWMASARRALADEAARQPREVQPEVAEWVRMQGWGIPSAAADQPIVQAAFKWADATGVGRGSGAFGYFVRAYVAGHRAALHDTAPTDQAQGGCTPEPAPQHNAEIVERCAQEVIAYVRECHDAHRRPLWSDVVPRIRALATPIQGEI